MAPQPYARGYGFANWQAQHPSDPLPGGEVDTELDAIAANTAAIISSLGAIQRSDGALANAIVTQESLATQVVALFTAIGVTPRGAWLTATAYAAKDVITQAGAVYLCAVPHTSGVFATDLAAGKWMLLSTAAANINQSLNTTDSPTFAGLTIGGAATVGSILPGDIIAPANFGRTKSTTKIAQAAGATPNIFSIPLTMNNSGSAAKIKISAVNDDVSAGYGTEYSEWVVLFGSFAGAYVAPTVSRTVQFKRSVNSAVLDLTVTVTAGMSGNNLMLGVTLNSGGGTGFTTGRYSAQIELIGVDQATAITAL